MISKLKYYLLQRQYTLDELIQFLLSFALIVVPVFFIPDRSLIDPYSQPRFIMLLVIACLFILIFIFEPHRFFAIINRNKTINTLVLIYILILTISLTYSVDLGLSLFGFHFWKDGYVVQIVYFTLFFAAQMEFVLNKKILTTMIVIGVFVALYGVLQNFGIDFMQDSNFISLPVTAGMYNQNFLGSYFVLILPITVFSYLKLGNSFYLLSFFIQFYVLLGTLTRGAWLGFLSSLVTLAVLVVCKKIIFNNGGRKVLFLIISLILAILLFDFFNENVLLGRLLSIFYDTGSLITGENSNTIGSYRGYIWSRTINYIGQRPLQGYGIQNIMLYFLSDYLKEMFKLFNDVILVNNVHNEYLQIAVSTGIPSLVIIAIAAVRILKTGFNRIDKHVILLPILLSIIGYLVQYFFSLSFISNTFILYIMLGSILSDKENTNSNDY